MRRWAAFCIILLSINGVFTQPSISTGDSPPVLGGSDIAAVNPPDVGSASDNTATGAAAAPAQLPAPTPKPRTQAPKLAPHRAPAAAPNSAPKPAPRKPGAVPPAEGPIAAFAPSKVTVGRPVSDAAGPPKAAVKPRSASAKAPAPGKASAREAADIVNIIEARAGAVTRSNTLFLAAVGARVDWIADLGKDGRHVGRFPMEQFISDAFNESSAGGTAWLGNPQAVIQGVPSGQDNSTTIVVILSAPTWNATAETLTFDMTPVTSEAALKLRDGIANGAFAGRKSSGLQRDPVGTVLKDVMVYIDDATMQKGRVEKGADVQKGASLGMNACKSVNFGSWRGPWIWDMYSGCL
ncbi:g6996 [Coccomyxa viridis]|uniref:G6996 protein n=1 Tax=Coccomyxa viridis TaxID=1274662 RepID=A0ABP1G3E3_9CHLO